MFLTLFHLYSDKSELNKIKLKWPAVGCFRLMTMNFGNHADMREV